MLSESLVMYLLRKKKTTLTNRPSSHQHPPHPTPPPPPPAPGQALTKALTSSANDSVASHCNAIKI